MFTPLKTLTRIGMNNIVKLAIIRASASHYYRLSEKTHKVAHLVLTFWRTHKAKTEQSKGGEAFSLKRAFPMFILYFVLASIITTVCTTVGVPAGVFTPLKTLSKFFIVMAMAAIGMNTNIVKLVKTGGKPIFMGFCCWVAIACVSIAMQHLLGFAAPVKRIAQRTNVLSTAGLNRETTVSPTSRNGP